MTRGPLEIPTGAGAVLDTARRSKRVRKSLLAATFLAVAALALLYRSIYPLELGLESGYLAGIPLVFWPILVAGSVLAFAAALAFASDAVSFLSIVLLSVLINYKQYLYFNFSGGDAAGEIARWFTIGGLPRFGVDLFDYFQWPMHYLFFETFGKVLALPLIETIRAGYVSLYVIFAVAAASVFYVYTSSHLYWVGASVVYAVYMGFFLNNQLVPQLFALVVLLFLFALGRRRTRGHRSLRLLFYVVLVLSHPFFFVFYLGFLVAVPFARSLRAQLLEFGGPDRTVYAAALASLRRPVRATRAWLADGLRGFVHNYLAAFAAGVMIYLFFLLTRFVRFRQRFLALMSKESQDPYGSGFVLSLLVGDASDPVPVGRGTRLLYDLTHPLFPDIARYGLIALLVFVSLFCLVAFLRTPAERLSPVLIAIGVVGVAYYVAGFFLPIIGLRGLQVALLPVGALIAGRRADRRTVVVALVVVLVLAPVVGFNGLVNASIGGGGNTQDLHAHQAGKHLAETDVAAGATVLRYPEAGLPLDFTGPQDRRVIDLEEFVFENASRPSAVVFGPRQVLLATRYGRECTFRPRLRNVVYDNSVSVLVDSDLSGPFECVPDGEDASP
jgi:hypothetical protein